MGLSGSKSHEPTERMLQTPQDQYERCMSDNELTLENKRRADITLDEVAEYHCKPLGCKLQLCMSTDHHKSSHRNALTGAPMRMMGQCEKQQEAFYRCVRLEKHKLDELVKAGVPWAKVIADQQ
jgi:hypothetical protein